MKTCNYFFVFQNKTYIAEKNGGFLWAPKKDSRGYHKSHWSIMEDLNIGDVIFHSVKGKIVAISIATTNCFDAIQPQDLQREEAWSDEGWRVNCEYHLIENPIITSKYKDELLLLQPEKYAPFNCIGRGNTGYLFKTNIEFSKFLFDKLIAINPQLSPIKHRIFAK